MVDQGRVHDVHVDPTDLPYGLRHAGDELHDLFVRRDRQHRHTGEETVDRRAREHELPRHERVTNDDARFERGDQIQMATCLFQMRNPDGGIDLARFGDVVATANHIS